MNIKTEIIAGLTTFSSMVYIIFVNPSILQETGLDFGALMVGTILTTAFSCLFMGFYSNQPIAIAPGMGVSAFFTYTVILRHGMPVGMGLAAVFLSALILLILNLLGIRAKILNSIPRPLIKGAVVGIGLFLIMVGLKQIGIAAPSESGMLVFNSPFTLPSLLTGIGVILIGALLYFEVRAAFILGILALWAISLIFGMTEWQGLIASPPSLEPNWMRIDFGSIFTRYFPHIFFSIFLVTLFDSSAALIVLSRMLYPDGKMPNQRRCLTPDTCGSMLGSLIGVTSMAIHLESAAGIKAGGRKGLTPIIVAALFLLCLFFYPLCHSIPHFASAPVLIVIGILMIEELKGMAWGDITDVIPMLIAIFVMPITFSIYLGFALGYVSYAIMKLITWRVREIHFFTWLLALLFAIHLTLMTLF
ncbi:MAG: NCS2 family permease [Simkaniaceae bacterium]|nr:NCS2 family permease [Simkaniaceae bacterium]